MYSDYIHISPGRSARGDFGQFGAPGIAIEKEYDAAFAEALAASAERAGIPAGTLGERNKALDHGTLVPLYFIERAFQDYRLVRVSISGLPYQEHYRFGECIAETADALSRRTVLIASGDLSHKLTEDGPYGFAKEGPEFDRQVTEAMAAGDFLRFLTFDGDFCEAAAECGLRSFIEMAGALDGKSVDPEFLSHEGPFGVGYAVCAYTVTGGDGNRRFGVLYERAAAEELKKRKEGEDEFVRLARLSLETYVKTGMRLKCPLGLSEDLTQNRAGVFVSPEKGRAAAGLHSAPSPRRRPRSRTRSSATR